MSTQITVALSTTPTQSSAASRRNLQTVAGYRELAAHAAANAATHVEQANRFAEQGQSELAHVCHHLAQEAMLRSAACVANADFFENECS